MLLSPFTCLRSLHPARRRWPWLNVLLSLFVISLLFLFLSLSGHLEEGVSDLLPLFYGTPTHPSSSNIFHHSLPSFLISPPSFCSKAPFLLILVSSAPSHRDQRDAIRQTWGSLSTSAASDSLTLFVLAVPQSEGEKAAVIQEAQFHGDIIQAAFTDTYRNLTLKTLAGLSWALQKCQRAEFLLKTDDDVFVNTPALSQFLRGQKGPLYLGRVHWRVSPIRDLTSRHYTSPEIYAERYFPPYCSGTGYILSQEAARLLLRKMGRGPWLSLEDVYIGTLAWAAGLAPRHSAMFAGSMTAPHTGCCYSNMFTSHGVIPQRMAEAWGMLREAKDAWCPGALLRCKVLV
ncbi:beta-1,3-galactosyltransferase 4 [Pelodytes ibericus]